MRLQREGDQLAAAGLSGATTFDVFADGACRWTAQSGSAWVTLTEGGSGTGNGVISYFVQPNPSPEPRVAVIQVGIRAFAVNQIGRDPSTDQSNGDGGGDGGTGGGGSSGGDSG